MRIVQNSSAVLHIDHNPWIMRWGIWVACGACFVSSLINPSESLAVVDRVFGIMLGLGGLVFGWYFMPRSAAILDRVRQTVTLSESRAFSRVRRTSHSLSEIDAVIATEGGGEYAGLQSLQLVIGGVRTPLEKGYVAADRKGVRDETIRWLKQARA